jgi:AcrR family transcriptional regulator
MTTKSPKPKSEKKPADSPTRGVQARAQTTRDRILRAAIKVFSKKGFDGGSVEAISKLSRSHDRMIYYYFGSKEKLFVEALETVYQRMNEAETALDIDIDNPREALEKIVHFHWQYYREHPEFLFLLNDENLHEGKHLQKKSPRTEAVFPPAVNLLDAVLRAGAGKGLFRPDIRALDLYIAIAALGYFYLSNRYTLSAFLQTDLMEPEALAHWPVFATDLVLRLVSSN